MNKPAPKQIAKKDLNTIRDFMSDYGYFVNIPRSKRCVLVIASNPDHNILEHITRTITGMGGIWATLNVMLCPDERTVVIGVKGEIV